MQKNKKRKGFTLTELAIVIAVIAILIAVLVPTFVSLINKANESADEQAVKSMNTALATDEALNGRKTNPSEAMQVLEDNGFNVANYEALDSDNTIYWDSSTNRTLLYSTEKASVIYPSDAVTLYSTYDLTASIPDYWYTLKDAYKTYTQSDIASAMKVTDPSIMEMLMYISTTYNAEEVTLQLTSNATLESTYVATNTTVTSTANKDTYTVNGMTFTDEVTSSYYPSEQFSFSGDVSYTIDLNGNTITHTTATNSDKAGRFIITDGASLYLKNGTLVDQSVSGSGALFKVNKDSSLTLEDVTVTTAGCALYPNGSAAQVNVINCNITAGGECAVGTNASTSENYYVQISIKDSVITANGSGVSANNYSDYAVCINVPGTLNISGSTLTGDRQGLIVRGGTAYVSDSTITCTGKYNGGAYYTGSSSWGSVPDMPMGAVVIGDNKTDAYKYDADCTLTDVTLVASTSANVNNCLVYMYSEDYYANLTYSGCNFTNSDIAGKGGNLCYVNGEKVTA